MFESISGSLANAFRFFRGQTHLTEANIQEGLREVRKAFLEADVNFKVVKEFVQRVSKKAVGEEVLKSLKPDQVIVKIVHDELVALLGGAESGKVATAPNGPTVILMAGLQGSGKTTTCGKLAKYLVKKGRKPLLVAADVQRPAAVEQLVTIGQSLQVPVHFEREGRPPKICERGVAKAVETGRDVVILDTAGRLHIDKPLMDELKEIRERTKPHEVFLVCDAMTGQDAVNSAKEFNDLLALSGVILTKLDGDTRGGAALSIKEVTGKPIRFVGVGEKPDDLEEFHADRMASRILGMGDVVTLVEKAQEAITQEEAEEALEKLVGDGFNFEDFLKQMKTMRKMGPLKSLLGMLPGMGALKDLNVDEDKFKYTEAIINSMTRAERLNPDLIDVRRRQRISRGSGRSIGEVNELIKGFKMSRKAMKGMGALFGKGGKGGGKGPGGLGSLTPRQLKELKKFQQGGGAGGPGGGMFGR